MFSDSYEYQRERSKLAELLKSGKVADWATAGRPIHVKIIAIPFAIFGPLFGYGTLSAEPYNLLFYATVIALVFTLGREVVAAVLGCWPVQLLQSTQLSIAYDATLERSAFVAASLALSWV